MENEYFIIKNLQFTRWVARLLPIRHKLQFLVSKYLVEGKKLAIPYTKGWFICTTVTGKNLSTLQEILLEGNRSLPEASFVDEIRNLFPRKMVLVDVGGNIGGFFSNFIDKCSRVVVFEPVPRLS